MQNLDLTPRQQAAYARIVHQGNLKGIDKGMVKALKNKGFLFGDGTPRRGQEQVTNFFQTHKGLTANQQACLDKIEAAYQIMEKNMGVALTRVPVEFSNRMTQCAGRAHYNRTSQGDLGAGGHTPKKIVLSNRLLELNGQDFIDETPGHEAAHLISVELWGNRGEGHGTQWKRVMREIGQSANRCHNMQTPKTGGYTYVATCGTEITLSKVRHNKIQRQGLEYKVKRTGGIINRAAFKGAV